LATSSGRKTGLEELYKYRIDEKECTGRKIIFRDGK
jgi:hypothetical protein